MKMNDPILNWAADPGTARHPVQPKRSGSRSGNPTVPLPVFHWLLLLACLQAGAITVSGADVKIEAGASGKLLRVRGDKDNEWRFQSTSDLITWYDRSDLGAVFSSKDDSVAPVTAPPPANGTSEFYRVVRTLGLFDPDVIRTVKLTFAESNWQSLLTSYKASGTNLTGNLEIDGQIATGVGVRYKGNTSYSMSGAKKSLNIEINWTNAESNVRGFKTINLNNAAGDESILRETLYFNVMMNYVPCPQAGFAQLYINGENWGLYSFVEQENSDLVNRWFPSNDGDRWRAPNAPGMTGGTGGGGGGMPPGGGTPTGGGTPPGGGAGGGGFTSGVSALTYLGTNVTTYQSNYELKTDNSTNAWDRLIHATDILNNTSDTEIAEKIHEVLNVDRWLWFLAIENVFADDDSYFNKGADYVFYYEPESGQIHPIEHDGNESFTAGDVQLSPVIGEGNTNRPVLMRLLAVPEYRQRYIAHMHTVLEEFYNPAVLGTWVDHYSALTRAWVAADPKKSYTMTQYDTDVAGLKTFIQQRHAFLTNHAELRPLPPVIVDTRDPVPDPTPDVTPFVTADVRASGNEGIDSVWLYHRINSYGRFTSVQMFDDGKHGDGAANDGTYGGATAPYPAGTKVHYYVEARSGNPSKAAAFHPALAELDTHAYRVAVGAPAASSVIINEVMADNQKTIADPQGEFDDWIELRNTGTAEVDLSGMYLSDEPSNPRKWQFPAGTKLGAGGYLIVWTDEDGEAAIGLHASFKLSANGETIVLVDTDARNNALLDTVTFDNLSSDTAYGRRASDPTKFDLLKPSPGTVNP